MRDVTSDPAAFYAELTKRNAGLISNRAQELLRTIRFVIAGCGSTGGATVEPLVRAGATRFVLADPDVYEVSNLNRQDALVADVGRNKAETAAARVLGINPHADVTILPEGIDPESSVLEAGDVVIDAIDVTTEAGLVAKLALHRQAHAVGAPVITAYDIAGTQLVEVFDYRRRVEVLRGKVTETGTPSEVLEALIPAWTLPGEILPIVGTGALADDNGFPQLGATARLFGAMIVPIVIRVTQGKRLPRRIRVDVFAIARPLHRRIGYRLATFLRLPGVWLRVRRSKR